MTGKLDDLRAHYRSLGHQAYVELDLTQRRAWIVVDGERRPAINQHIYVVDDK